MERVGKPPSSTVRRIGLAVLGIAFLLMLTWLNLDPTGNAQRAKGLAAMGPERSADLDLDSREPGGRTQLDPVPEEGRSDVPPYVGTLDLHGPAGLWILDALSGRPVEGAKVLLDGTGWKVGTTGARGEVEVWDSVLDSTKVLRARVECEGYLPAAIQADFQATREAYLRIWPGVSIVGLVRSTGGESLEGVEVKVLCNTKGGPALEEWLTTDALGNFHTWVPASSRVTLVLRRSGYAQYVEVIVATVDGEEFEFEMARARPFAGRVIDAFTGAGIEGATLQPVSCGQAATSGSGGRFELDLDPRARSRVFVSHGEYMRVEGDANFDEQPATLPLIPFLNFSGVLRRPEGSGPLPSGWEHAEVLVIRGDALVSDPLELLETSNVAMRGIKNPTGNLFPMDACFLDAHGQFKNLRVVPSDVGLTAMVIGPTGWTKTLELPTNLATGEAHWIEIPCMDAHQTVRAQVSGVDLDVLPHLEIEAIHREFATVGTGRVDGNGIATFEFPVPADSVSFSVFAVNGFRRLGIPSDSAPLNCVAGSTRDVSIELEWQFETLDGRAQFDDGSLAIGAWIFAYCPDAKWHWTATSDSRGGFSLVVPKGFDGKVEAQSGLSRGTLDLSTDPRSILTVPIRSGTGGPR